MHQIRLSIFLLSVVAFAHCASAKKTDGAGKAPETISSAEEGFIGEDVIAVVGEGTSKEGLTDPVRKAGTAKEAARMDAHSKVVEFCRGPGGYGYSPVENRVMAESAVGKDLAALMRKSKAKKTECKADGDRLVCKVLLVFERKAVRRDCELAMAESAK